MYYRTIIIRTVCDGHVIVTVTGVVIVAHAVCLLHCEGRDAAPDAPAAVPRVGPPPAMGRATWRGCTRGSTSFSDKGVLSSTISSRTSVCRSPISPTRTPPCGSCSSYSLAALHDRADLRRASSASPTRSRGRRPDLGAGSWFTFRTVLLPMILPGVVAGSIFTFSLTLGDFITPLLIGRLELELLRQTRDLRQRDQRRGPTGCGRSRLRLDRDYGDLSALRAPRRRLRGPMRLSRLSRGWALGSCGRAAGRRSFLGSCP